MKLTFSKGFRYTRQVLVAVFFILPVIAFGQDTSITYIDISTIDLVDTINTKLQSAYISKDSSIENKISSIEFHQGLIHNRGIPPKYVDQKVLLKFNIYNPTDSTKGLYFFPGFYFENIKLYRLNENTLTPLPSIVPKNPDSIGYRYISLVRSDTVEILAELFFVKTYTNNLRPRLINEKYLDAYILKLHNLHGSLDLVTYIFCGLLLMMILYSWANYLQGANREFLFYSGFALFLGVMLFTKSFFTYQATSTNFFLESYLDFIMQCIGYVFYMIFMQKFLETKRNFPFLNRLYNYALTLLGISIISFSFFHFFTSNFSLQNAIETWTKNLLLGMVIIFLIYSLRFWNDKLMKYLFWGNLSLLIFSLASQAVIIFNPKFRLPGIFNASLFYYEIGLLLELIFFLLGLTYKNRRQIIEQTREREWLKTENQMKEYEKELAVYKAQQEERNRISADMHDELGSGMTAIRLMCEIAKNKMKHETPKEIEKISHSADDLLNKMNAIIWSMNSGNDTLDNLISYIRVYALEYFESTSIECKIQTPEVIPPRELTGDKRRNIFLCVKETLNNVLKHSKATEVRIVISTNERLVIRIVDNGIGIDLRNIRQFGNGIQNITRRMKSVGGTFIIINEKGTITTLELPL